MKVLGGLLGYGREAKRSIEGRVRVPGGLLGQGKKRKSRGGYMRVLGGLLG